MRCRGRSTTALHPGLSSHIAEVDHLVSLSVHTMSESVRDVEKASFSDASKEPDSAQRSVVQELPEAAPSPATLPEIPDGGLRAWSTLLGACVVLQSVFTFVTLIWKHIMLDSSWSSPHQGMKHKLVHTARTLTLVTSSYVNSFGVYEGWRSLSFRISPTILFYWLHRLLRARVSE